MKYKSYQVGGVVYSPIGPSQQVQQTTSSSSSDTKSEKISGTMKEEIVKILKENGIPSDVDAFLNKANQFLNKSTSLSNMSLFGGTDDDYDLTDLITIQKMANDVRFNNERYKTATSNLDSENAWADVAIDNRGYMWVADGENLKTVSASEFDPGKHHALTNEQLLALRERSSQFAMDTGILNSMSGVIGMGTIQNHIVDLIKQLGTSSMTGYSSKEAEDIMSGAKILMQNGPDGFYKITDKQQARSVSAALNYIKDHINANSGMRNVLRATIAANGGDPTKDMNSMIAQMLSQHVNTDLSADFDSAATKAENGDLNGNSEGSLGEIPYLVRIGRGDGQYDLVNISMRTDSVMKSGSMIAWAANMGNLVDKNGNTLGMDSLPNILQKAEAIQATRSKDITFGGQLLNDVDKNFVVYDGTSQITDIWLPYKNDGGRITPDFDKLKAFNEWNDWVSKNKGLSKVDIMNEAYKMGLDPQEMDYNEQTNSWQFKPAKMKLFLSFSAYADNDNIEFTKLTEDLTEEMPTEFGRKYKDVFNNLFEYGKTHRTKSDKKIGLNYDTVRSWDLRKGNVFIPIDSDFLAMHMSMKEYAPKSDMNRFAARSELTQQMAYNQDNVISSLGQWM